MAKAPKTLRSALAATRSYGRQLSKEATADYKVAMSGSLAGQLGLAKQTRGLTRDLVLGQNKNTVMLDRLAARAAASKGQVRQQIAGSTSRYGAALGASVASQYSQASATAKSNAQVQAGYSRMGQKTAATAGTVAGIAAKGVQAQKQAANYALAQALQQRNIADNQVVGQMQADLYKQQMALDAQKEMARYQFQLEQKQLKKEEDKQMPGLQQVVDGMGSASYQMLDWYREHQDDENLSANSMATAWVNEYGSGDPNETQAMQVLAAKLYSRVKDTDINATEIQDAVHDSVTQAFSTAYPHFKPAYGTVDNYVTAGTTLDAFNAAAEAAPGSGDHKGAMGAALAGAGVGFVGGGLATFGPGAIPAAAAGFVIGGVGGLFFGW